jgi:hypothetical protein
MGTTRKSLFLNLQYSEECGSIDLYRHYFSLEDDNMKPLYETHLEALAAVKATGQDMTDADRVLEMAYEMRYPNLTL